MTLEMYQSDGGRTMFRCDGKRVNSDKADELYFAGVDFIDNTTCHPYEEFKAKLDAFIEGREVNFVAESEIKNGVEVNTVFCSDRLTAIRIIEKNIAAPFIIDHKVKGCNAVFAKNAFGDYLEMHDDHITVTCVAAKLDKKETVKKIFKFNIDIPESRFIEEFNAVINSAVDNNHPIPDTFQIVGDSGVVYTFDQQTLVCLDVTDATEKSVDVNKAYLIRQFKLTQQNFKTSIKRTDKATIGDYVRGSRFITEAVLIARKIRDFDKSAENKKSALLCA